MMEDAKKLTQDMGQMEQAAQDTGQMKQTAQDMGQMKQAAQDTGQIKQTVSPEGAPVKKQSLGTILLLVVGSIFIAVAACIFAYKAWAYMTEDMKKMLIVVAAAAFFGLSHLAEKKIKVRGSASALYYLATVFTGLAAAVLVDADWLHTALHLQYYRQAGFLHTTIILTALLIPMALRLYKSRKAWDCILSVGLAEAIVYSELGMFDMDSWEVVSLISCIVQIVLLYLYHRVKQMEGEKSLKLGMKIVCMVQAVLYFLIFVTSNMFAAVWWIEVSEAVISLLVLTLSFGSMYVYSRADRKIPALVNTTADLFCLTVALAGMEMKFIPEAVVFEKGLLCAAAGVWMLGRIFRLNNIEIKYVQFSLNCLIMAAWLFHNIEDGELINVLLLGGTALAMMLLAIWKNHKGYTVLGGVTLILLVLYATRRFWLSVSWWVYLMAAGMIMIGIAVERERRNR